MQYRLMVVDDSKFIVTILSNLLSKNGYAVKSYISAEDAISEIETFAPHLILSDYNMPGMNGFNFCERVKSSEKTKDIKFILLTAVDDVDAKVRCFEIGADDYILKPFNHEEVLARVKTHISLKQLQDDLTQALNKIEQELDIVAEIQRRLLPDSVPEIDNIKFDSYYNTYSKSGGDYFDFIEIDDNNTGIVIVDVSGHGTSSTVLMTMVKIFFSKVLNKIKSPSEVLYKLNNEMLNLVNVDKFATIFYGILNKTTLEMTFANAAHPEPLIINRLTKETFEISGKKGLPCGILPVSQDAYTDEKVILKPDERIIFYTDGIIEARKDTSDIFGEKRFIDLLVSTIELPLDEAKNEIIENVLSFAGNKLNDDITMVMFDVY